MPLFLLNQEKNIISVKRCLDDIKKIFGGNIR
jgi:hypothetical protein